MNEVVMPALVDGMEEGTVVAWLVASGSEVHAGDEIVEIETDKAAMAYAAEADGYLEVVAQAGARLPVGAVMARLHDTPVGEESEKAVASTATEVAKLPMLAAPVAQPDVMATPLARRMAAAHGVPLDAIAGTGPRGRVTAGDVADRAGIQLRPGSRRASHVETPSPAVTTSTGAKGLPTRRPLSRLQETVARRMAESKATIPHFQVQAEVQVDSLIGLRAHLRDEAACDPVPSINDLIVKASALALREFPLANGAFRDGTFELYERVNVGIAVAAEDTLVVPVISDADARSVIEIAAESRRLAGRVRDGSVTPPELAGGTFTVSNLGMFGMTAIYPVINPGQAAILGVGASRTLTVTTAAGPSEQQLMTLTLSCDHRILYGVEAARFLRGVADRLERPLQLLI